MGAVGGNYWIALREGVIIASRNASVSGHHPTIRRVSDDFFQSSVQHCCLLPSSALICREIPLRTSTTHKSCKHLSHFGHKASSLCHKSQTPSKTQKHTRRPSQVRERRSHTESSFLRSKKRVSLEIQGIASMYGSLRASQNYRLLWASRCFVPTLGSTTLGSTPAQKVKGRCTLQRSKDLNVLGCVRGRNTQSSVLSTNGRAMILQFIASCRLKIAIGHVK